ncbi:MAG: carbon-nitrogen hydrolase family protein [Gemmatimonadota bacterium]
MEGLRVASCQFPVSADVRRNAAYVARYLERAASAGAHLLHTSEACLSGYAGIDFPSFDGYDWDLLRQETARLRARARQLGLWLVLGSAHYLDARTPATNCLYLVGPRGRIADRYDKCMCTKGDQKSYSAGRHLVVRTVRGVRLGLAICYDVCYPQVYAAYRQRGVALMLHSFYNAGARGPNCLDVLNVRQVPTRCADNRMWAVANNSSRRYSHWASFVARPDATIARQLRINQAGMLVHDFPDGLSEGGWLHNYLPMKLAPGERLHFGRPSRHPRQLDRQSEP